MGGTSGVHRTESGSHVCICIDADAGCHVALGIHTGRSSSSGVRRIGTDDSGSAHIIGSGAHDTGSRAGSCSSDQLGTIANAFWHRGNFSVAGKGFSGARTGTEALAGVGNIAAVRVRLPVPAGYGGQGRCDGKERGAVVAGVGGGVLGWAIYLCGDGNDDGNGGGCRDRVGHLGHCYGHGCRNRVGHLGQCHGPVLGGLDDAVALRGGAAVTQVLVLVVQAAANVHVIGGGVGDAVAALGKVHAPCRAGVATFG
mmetsp:Transcript_17301/g.37912  ORF Transcript_17301/g.37912 Transcript_17301/m.37912 type:complete len:255 (-) Transcript_17301:951-1715(-)